MAQQSIAASITRLKDPNEVAKSPRQYQELCEKVSSCMTRMFQYPKNGGNPFLFALSGPKPHYLARDIGGQPISTAATDGKNFYWNPEWLESMEIHQVQTVMSHESYHVLFFHCSPERAAGKNPKTWNISVDYVVNGVIEHDHEKSGRSAAFKLWGGVLGSPISFSDYLAWIAGTLKGELPQPGMFADPTLHGRSPESIYADIIQAELSSPRRCKEHQGGCGAMSIDPKTGKSSIPLPWDQDTCQKCGAKPNHGPGSMDSHFPSGMTKDEVMGEMMRAAEQATAGGRGTAPSEVEEALSELKKPTLRPSDFIRQAFMQKAIDTGSRNDWKRLRRRQLAMTPQQFLPRKHDHKASFLCLLDCSGSMADIDVANGLKELACVTNVGAEGLVVPCDAAVYWEQATKITKTTDLKRTKVVGRGGTVFDEFFAEFPKRVGIKWDIVVIITDGDCGHIPMSLKPRHQELLWVITNKREFKPSFGRVVQLNPSRA